MGTEDDLLLNGNIANRKIKVITLVLISMKIIRTLFVLMKMMMKITLILTMITTSALTMTWKTIELFRIATTTYPMTTTF